MDQNQVRYKTTDQISGNCLIREFLCISAVSCNLLNYKFKITYMTMSKSEINEELLTKTAGGFPDGELPSENTRICPRCGTSEDRLELVTQQVIENTGSKIDALIKDHTYRLYKCQDCGFTF